MSDIKISDVFELPVFAKNHGVGERCSIFEGKSLTVASSFYSNQLDRYELICNAINNHDRLTEENAQLKADKAELILGMNKIYVMMHEFYDEHDFDGSTCDLAMHELLQKHKEPNNA